MAVDQFLKGISDLTGKLVGIFDNGIQIYQGIQTRLDALKEIDDEKPEPNNTVIVAPSPNQETSSQIKQAQGINNLSLLLIAAGTIGVFLLVVALRKK